MKLADPENPVLTKNDQKVLKVIIEQAKISDAEIARRMGLTQQAIFKIRHKLEEKGIIKGYQPVIDYKKVGINVLVLLGIRILPVVWEDSSEEQVAERIGKVPYVINAFRIPESDITHVLLMGFRNIHQKDRYLMKLQTRFARELEIKMVFPFSVDRVITMNPLGLLYEMIDKKEYPLEEFFIVKKGEQPGP